VPQGGLNRSPNPKLVSPYTAAYISMGETAENVAKRFQISRQDQEALAVDSHRKAAAARRLGRLRGEIVPMSLESGEIIDSDGCIREGTSLEALAALKPAFAADGLVTAGTSSPLTDGAAAVLVTSDSFARSHKLEPLARIHAMATVGCDPSLMGIGPIPATRKALARAGRKTSDLDVIELNEAFASQALACIRDLGLDPDKINLDGGGMALGHPLGATGARITGKAAALLKREGGRYALATQCIGGGQGIATILEAA
jgi:acetyl-CoA acyltransferase